MSERVNEDDFSTYERILPAGSLPQFGISFVSYMTPDGEILDAFAIDGRVTLREALGTLELLKVRLSLQQLGITDESGSEDD